MNIACAVSDEKYMVNFCPRTKKVIGAHVDFLTINTAGAVLRSGHVTLLRAEF